MTSWDVLIVGGGPAGLAAAETASSSGARALLIEQMPSLGRKFLMAGKSGLNLTWAGSREALLAGYSGGAAAAARAAVAEFDADDLRHWASELGIETFVGSSKRVFPTVMKASPLLRAWIARLVASGVEIQLRSRLVDMERDGDGGWRLLVERSASGREAPARVVQKARSVVFAMGGASWPRLGSDGGWRALASRLGVELTAFEGSNVGWTAPWSSIFAERFAGEPLKNIALCADGRQARGEAMVTRYGLEGGLIYTLGRELSAAAGECIADLAPDQTEEALSEALARPRGKMTVTRWLERRARLGAVKIGLLRETGPIEAAPALARRIKRVPLRLSSKRPIEEAISTAGGVTAASLDHHGMARGAPGLFVAGEMMDWDAPTGGFLLTACIALGRRTGRAAARWAKVRV